MSSRHDPRWTRHLLLIAALLFAWLLATVVPVWVAWHVDPGGSDAHRVYWLTAYGAPLAYLCLIGVYGWLARRRGQ